MKLLIIDDEEGVRNVLDQMLRHIIDEPHEIYTVPSGEAAIALAKQHVFEGAFTDMQMPGIDGLETFRALKTISPEIKVVIMTGQADPERVAAALKEGAIHLLAKPFTMDEVRAVLPRN